MSVPTTNIYATKETDRYLYENHEKLNEEYRAKFNIESYTTDQEIFKIVHDYINETQGMSFEDVKDTLIGLAAVIGTVMVEVSDGYWEWDSNNGISWFKRKEKYPRKDYLLSTIINCWRENDDYTFEVNDSYNYMKKA
jgi:hypothetical protein